MPQLHPKAAALLNCGSTTKVILQIKSDLDAMAKIVSIHNRDHFFEDLIEVKQITEYILCLMQRGAMAPSKARRGARAQPKQSLGGRQSSFAASASADGEARAKATLAGENIRPDYEDDWTTAEKGASSVDNARFPSLPPPADFDDLYDATPPLRETQSIPEKQDTSKSTTNNVHKKVIDVAEKNNKQERIGEIIHPSDWSRISGDNGVAVTSKGDRGETKTKTYAEKTVDLPPPSSIHAKHNPRNPFSSKNPHLPSDSLTSLLKQTKIEQIMEAESLGRFVDADTSVGRKIGSTVNLKLRQGLSAADSIIISSEEEDASDGDEGDNDEEEPGKQGGSKDHQIHEEHVERQISKTTEDLGPDNSATKSIEKTTSGSSANAVRKNDQQVSRYPVPDLSPRSLDSPHKAVQFLGELTEEIKNVEVPSVRRALHSSKPRSRDIDLDRTHNDELLIGSEGSPGSASSTVSGVRKRPIPPGTIDFQGPAKKHATHDRAALVSLPIMKSYLQ